MYERVGTKNCIACGKPAKLYSGHLKAYVCMALGNLIEIKIVAGWCSIKCHNSMKSNKNGCFGEYDNTKMDLVEDYLNV